MSGPELHTEHVTWQHPTAGYAVQYSLPVFREIEFLVNDGFRRIPHGGVETGGLLFGFGDASTLRIDSFRQIECEHAFGPSFQLSDRDIERLEQQIATSAEDQSLDHSVPVGWFIAHTRSELVLTEREVELFRRLFPEPGRVTVLAKPERFKSTRFAFLIRDRKGDVQEDGTSISFTLPQPERGGTARRARAPENENPHPAIQQQAAPPQPVEDTVRSTPVPQPVAAPEPVPVAEEPDVTRRPEPVSELPELLFRRRERVSIAEAETAVGSNFLIWALFGASLVFAVLAIYGFYLRVVSAPVPVTVTPSGDAFIISWPASETQGAEAAELRVNNGPAQTLSEEQKASGTFSMRAGGGDLIVDLVVHHRFRTSRGVTRYMVMPAASTP